jgi:hypothetical protein
MTECRGQPGADLYTDFLLLCWSAIGQLAELWGHGLCMAIQQSGVL